MKNIHYSKNILSELIAASLILLFVYTGTSKLFNHYAFADVIMQSPIIGTHKNFLSWFIPIIELAISVLLFFPGFRLAGLYSSLLLLLAFTTYIGYMLIYDSHLPCSCGGVIQSLSWGQHFIFNVVMVAAVLVGIVLEFRFSTQSHLRSSLTD